MGSKVFVQLPEKFIFPNFQIDTLILFFILSIFFLVFTAWYEARKDGFDDRRFFDILFTSLLVSFGLGWGTFNFYTYLATYYPTSFPLYLDAYLATFVVVLCGYFAPVYVIAPHLKWSKFRILDIFSLSASVFMFIISTGLYFIKLNDVFLILAAGLAVLYVGVLRFRGYKFISGLIYSVVLIFSAGMIIWLFAKSGYLLLVVILTTISLWNIISIRDRFMFNIKFLSSLKNKLLAKKKDLAKEERLLRAEDPARQPGRAEDNSEVMDEIILGDVAKEISDLELKEVNAAEKQVASALDAMKKGTYGTCERCQKPIDAARLKALPEATLCFDCANRNIK